MTEEFQFIYKEEYWYISAFLNTVLVDGLEKSAEIENIIKEEFKNLKPEDIFRQDLKDDIIGLYLPVGRFNLDNTVGLD